MGVRIDISTNEIIVKIPVPSSAFDNSVYIDTIGNINLYALAPVDVVVLKLVPGRPRDLEDIDIVMENNAAMIESVRARRKEYIASDSLDANFQKVFKTSL